MKMLNILMKKICRSKENITVKEMLEIIKTNDNAVLLDVRSTQEYKEGHIRGSINIPVYDIEKEAPKKLDKNSIIIVYCSAGIRSKRALQILKKQGYKNLYNIEGGIENLWMKY